MATSRSFQEFAQRMKALALEFEANTEREIRTAALVADQVVVLATPVDTGRARSNWVVSVGVPEFRDQDPGAPGQAATQAIEQGKRGVADWRVGAGPIFIANGVSYIEPLDKGSSAQAPEGMTAQAVEAASRYLRARARVLKR